jgi:glycosyltransferase involved in cell wall biosynthesis
MAPQMKPRVSIIIPTRNRAAIVARGLAALSLGTSGLEPPEVIVVDDCSNDDTSNAVHQFCSATSWQVRYLRQDRPLGANAARNAALKVAQGEIIVFIDDDVLVTEAWLCKLLAGLSEQVPVVSGPVRLTIDASIPGKHREEVSSYLSEVLAPVRGLRGEIVPVACNMAAFRWVFDRACFDEKVRPPVEENDWLERAGVRAGFVQEAWVAHYKTPQELMLRRLLASAWRRGSEGGWWLRERLRIPMRRRFFLAMCSLRTSVRAVGHALLRGCWGGIVVGLGEFSKALALTGFVNREPRVPENWR